MIGERQSLDELRSEGRRNASRTDDERKSIDTAFAERRESLDLWERSNRGLRRSAERKADALKGTLKPPPQGDCSHRSKPGKLP